MNRMLHHYTYSTRGNFVPYWVVGVSAWLQRLGGQSRGPCPSPTPVRPFRARFGARSARLGAGGTVPAPFCRSKPSTHRSAPPHPPPPNPSPLRPPPPPPPSPPH